MVIMKREMNSTVNAVLLVLLLCCFASAANAQVSSPTPAPAPAPAPQYINLTDLLSVAGPFHTFLNYLTSTKVIDTFQNQANNTEEGITIFVPRDQAFSSLPHSRLSNLTQDQLKSLCLFHALPHYYALSEFRNLSQQNPIPTFAGANLYALNFTDSSGTIRIDSGWTKTKVTSAVHAADPVAIYETDRVLLPEAIFGTDIPPTPAPAPAPAPEAAAPPAADRASADGTGSSPTSSPSSSSSLRLSIVGVVSGIVGGGLLLLW